MRSVACSRDVGGWRHNRRPSPESQWVVGSRAAITSQKKEPLQWEIYPKKTSCPSVLCPGLASLRRLDIAGRRA
jgi:hypothetical protein